MKRVLILTYSKVRRERDGYYESVLQQLGEQQPDVDFKISSLEELDFLFHNGESVIRDNKQNFVITDFDLIVFRVGFVNTLAKKIKQDNTLMTLVKYCDKKQVKYIDSGLGRLGLLDDGNKLAEMFVLNDNKIAIPKTAYGTSEFLRKQAENFGWPVILKAIDGRKGQNNYLVNSGKELDDILANNPDTGFLLQENIANNGDYRVLTLNYNDVVITLRRRKSNDTHLNNVSAGAEEILVDDYSELGDVIELSKCAARVCKLEVAGVDVLVDEVSGAPYILEVNRTPELTLKEEVDGLGGAIKCSLHDT